MAKNFVSPLHRAVAIRNPAWVKRLLAEGGADLTVRDKWNHTLFEIAMINFEGEIAQMLLDAGAEGQPELIRSHGTNLWGVYTLLDGKVTCRQSHRDPHIWEPAGPAGAPPHFPPAPWEQNS